MLTIIDKAKMFREIINEMADLYEKKNANYGDSFGQLFDALGPISGLVPLHNKLDRATSLIKGNKNNFESLEDTFKDLACYAIMNLIEMKMRNQKIGEQGELTTAVSIEPEDRDEAVLLPEKGKDGKWYYKGQLADGWLYNKNNLMTGEGYSEGCPVRDMVYRNYDCTPHHFVPNDYKTATLKISEPVDFNFNPNTITTVKDPCAGCPWNQNVLFGTAKPYIGDTPCQWCEHGTKLTCNDLNYCTSTTIDNTNNVRIKATSSTGLEDSIVSSVMKDGTGERVSIETSGIMDEYWDIDANSLYTINADDELTIEEMAEAEREERAVWENIYSKYMTKRGDK